MIGTPNGCPMRVSEMPVAEQPATRLMNGVPEQTITELLACVIGGADAMSAANDVYKLANGSLRSLAALPASRLLSITGVGPAAAVRIKAAMELGKRAERERVDERAPVRAPRDVARLMAPQLEALPVEEFHVLLLDAQYRLVRDVLVTRGILTSSLVHAREVFREAVVEACAVIILVHNHPSGDPTPSVDDRSITEQLVAAGKLLGIPVSDHIIIGRGRYTSFAEAGLL